MSEEIKVDNKGIFDKIGIIDHLIAAVDALADAKGAVRCGLIWDISSALKALKKGLTDEEAANKAKIEELKRQIEILQGRGE